MARTRLQRSVLALASTTLALGAAELTLRVLDAPAPFDEFSFLGAELAERNTFEPDPDRFWRIAPNARHVEANEHGFRGNWVDPQKASNEYRVVCIGDSCTFGVGVRYDETFGVRIERELQNAWPRRVVSTVLLGVPGYSTHQCRAAFVPRARRLAPDLTILYVGAWNDFGAAVGRTDRELAALASGSRIRQVVERALGPDRATLAAEQKELFVSGRAPSRRRVSLAEFRENVIAIVDAARDAGSEVLAVLPTWPRRTIDDFPIVLEYSSALRELADEIEVPSLDAGRVFDSFCARVPAGWLPETDPRGSLFVDWVHPSAYGHRLLADAICDRVLERDPRSGRPRTEAIRVATPHPAVEDLGLALTGASRVTIGERSLFRIPGTDRWTTPAPLPAGAHPMRWVDDHGLVEHAAPFVVEPATLTVEVQDIGTSRRRLTIEIGARPGQAVAVWLSTKLAPSPVRTHEGDFDLFANAAGRPDEVPDFPFAFERVGLPGIVGEVDADGICALEQEIHVPPDRADQEIWVQALVRDGGTLAGTLTRAVGVRM